MSQHTLEGYQLSPQQKHLWSLCEHDGEAAYKAQCAILMEGPLDRKILRTALRDVIERHEILRTTFDFLSDMAIPLQVINEASELSIDEHDLSELPDEKQRVALEELLCHAGRLHSTTGNRLHFSEVRLARDKHVLLVTTGSLCADAAALKILMGEIADCYAACLRGEKLTAAPLQYADLSEWQNESLNAEGSDGGIDYWRRQQAIATDLRLPFEKNSSPNVEFRPASPLSLLIKRKVVEKLERVSALHASNVSCCLLGALSVVLSRVCSAPQLSFGVGFDGRNYDELADALGLFARLLPVHVQLPSDLPFPKLLASIDTSLADADRWQEFFSKHASTTGTVSFLPFGFEFVDDAAPPVQVTEALRFTLLRSSAYITRFKLLLRCLRQNDGSVVAEWHYDSALYGEEQARRLADSWLAALESITLREGALSIQEVSVVGAREQAQLRSFSRGPEGTWNEVRCIHEVFATQAVLTPNAIAVIYESDSISYRELDRRANQLAHYLRARGVGPDQCVGLMMERGVNLVVGLLGILKAGAAYLPLDPTQPSQRLKQMVSDARGRLIVSIESLRTRVQELQTEIQVYIDSEAIALDQESGEELQTSVQPENLAYVIYTSGSTGSAKAVGVEHRQLANYLHSILQRLQLPAGASFALVTTFAADLGNTVIFPALCSGGTLHLISAEAASDPAALADYFHDHSIDCLKIVPSHISALIKHSDPQRVLPGKCLVLGGEASSWQLIENIQGLAPDCRILNHYGPTETTVGVMTLPIEKDLTTHDTKTVPLGYPIANTQTYVLDSMLAPVSFGVPGELYIGGANVTRGYLNSPDATAARFIPNPFSTTPGERLYKSGDLSRVLPDGSIEFLGRTDDQIKVRGFRTEPAEIDAVLTRHPAVRQAKVLARETLNGEKRLVAYLVPDDRYASPVLQLMRLKREGRLTGRQCHELPNRMLVASQNKNETDFMYKEIFEERIYLQHGIILKDGDCVFDVGANIGMFSLFVDRMCKNTEIYAFEPIPPLFEALRTNAALYGLNAKLFKSGVSDEATPQEFTYYPHLTLMSGRFADLAQDQEVVKLFESNRRGPEERTVQHDELLDEVLNERMTSELFVCQMQRISDVIREHRIGRIDLLKIDVQKSEMDVLRGIEDGDWSKIEQVVLEVHDVDNRLQEIVSLLETHQFNVAVRQEAMLRETGLYDVYGVRCGRQNPLERRDGDKSSGDSPVWASPDSLIEDVRTYLQDNLPDHMIPSAFVLLESLPLTSNGKIDRQALPQPVEPGSIADKPIIAPTSETEELLAGIWRQVLGLSSVGIHDNFFELGGDSILSIQIVARANQAGLKLSPKQIFRHQSIAELSAATTEAAGSATVAVDAEQGLLEGPLPLIPIQRYFFEQALVDQHHFNQSLLFNVLRPVRADNLQRVMTALVEHHDALRLRFEQTDTGWQQHYRGADAIGEVRVEHVQLGAAGGAEQRAEVEAVCTDAQRSMNLERGGLLRVVLFDVGAEQRLLLVAHHLMIDGVSWRVLLEDLVTGYQQAERGDAIQFGRKTTSFRSWAKQLEQYTHSGTVTAELNYWRELERWQARKLPGDFAHGENTIESTRAVSVFLEAAETRTLLQEVPEVYRTQINDVLLTALLEAFEKWTGQRQLLLDMEGHGRADELFEDVDLSRTIGWFTTLFPVLLQMPPTTHGGALLKSAKEQLRRVPNRGIGYGLLRYLSNDEETTRAMRALPQAEIRFNYLGQLDQVLPDTSLFGLSQKTAGPDRDGKQRRAYLLDVTGAVTGGRLQLNVIYSEHIHRRSTIERFASNLVEALRAIISHCQSLESSDFSPSDFPLANLSQRQLDLIMSKTSGDRSFE